MGYVRGPVWPQGLFGATKRHFAENDPTSHAVWGITKRHFAENDPTSQAVWGITNCIDSGDLDELT